MQPEEYERFMDGGGVRQLVAELSMQVYILKKQLYQVWNKGEICLDEG